MVTSRGDEIGLASRWGWVVLRGVVAIVFGLLAFARPGAMTLSLVMLFAAYAFVGGIATIISAAQRGRAGQSWGMLMLDGVLGIAVAVVAVLWPASTAMAFVWVLGIWAILSGALELGSAVSLRKVIRHEWTLALMGLLTLAFGVLMFARPIIGAVAVVYTLGIYAIAFGVLNVAFGFRLRSYAYGHRELPTGGLPQRTWG
ncbi:MAG TPA: HdeD family acid-resistance protein [Polyangia bacterium]|jgi:uncharacterized membrane protein HdeD (DUF308 family)|nr:HdeD family acid-resistance protein [Polyangia bacterium]